MKAYFAHSMEIYGSAEAGVAKAKIKRLLPGCTVIDPENIDWVLLEQKYGSEGAFRRAVFTSDMVVVLENEGFVGRGVYCEIRAALGQKKQVFVLRDNRLREVSRAHVAKKGSNWKAYARVSIRQRFTRQK